MPEQMQPGRELSRLVAEAISELRSSHPGFYWQEFATEDGDGGDGFSCPRCGKSVSDPDESTKGDCYKYYSTHIEDAMEAWAWLEENNPWDGGLALYRASYNNLPTVVKAYFREGKNYDVFIQGETYPHAISLAVIEAAKEVRKK